MSLRSSHQDPDTAKRKPRHRKRKRVGLLKNTLVRQPIQESAPEHEVSRDGELPADDCSDDEAASSGEGEDSDEEAEIDSSTTAINTDVGSNEQLGGAEDRKAYLAYLKDKIAEERRMRRKLEVQYKKLNQLKEFMAAQLKPSAVTQISE